MSRTTTKGQRRMPALDARILLEGSRLRTFGVFVICLYVAFVPIVFDPKADFAFTVPKAMVSHALAYVLAGVIVGLVVQFGRRAIPWSWLHVAVAVLLVVNVAATIVAADRQLALFGDHGRMLGLGTLAAWTVLYFAVVILVRTRNDLNSLVAAAYAASIVMLAYEFMQLMRVDPVSWNTDTALRPFSTNGQATTFGAYLTVLAMSAAAIALTMDALSRRARSLWLLLCVVLLLGAAGTGTRSILFGLATGGTSLVILLSLRASSAHTRRLVLMTASVSAAVLAAVLALTPVGNRLLESNAASGAPPPASLDLATLDVRAVLYGVAVEAVRERPILGYGPDNFVVAMSRHRPEQGPEEARLSYATSAHSWIAQTAVGSGLLGLVSFLAVIAGASILAYRYRGATAACVGLVAIATFLGTGSTTVGDVAGDWVVWAGAGLIAGSKTSSSAPAPAASAAVSRGGQRGRRGGGHHISNVVPVVIGVAMALTTISALQASRAAKTSEDARLLARPGAVEAALAATALDAGRAEYWHDLGLAYVGVARWRDAALAFDRASRLAAWDPRNTGDLLQTQEVLARGGDAVARSRVAELADEVVALDPNHPDTQYRKAVAMQFLGNDPEALKAMERAMALLPNAQIVQWYVTAAQIYRTLGRPSDAVSVSRRGISVITTGASTVPIRLELVRALLANGQLKEALTEVDAVIASDPSNAAAKQLRVDIQAALTRQP